MSFFLPPKVRDRSQLLASPSVVVSSGKLAKSYIAAVLLLGSVCLAISAANINVAKLDLHFLILACCTIGLGSRITIPIPRVKSHIAVSDTFIFLTLLLYGGEAAIILSALEAFFSAWRFCNKKLTVFFNAAAMALSTSLVVLALNSFRLLNESSAPGNKESFSDFLIALSVIALTQFIANTALASIYNALNLSLPLWETWKNKYIWIFLTYSTGAAAAGILFQLANYGGFGVILAAFPIILFVFLTYKMYLKNVEMSLQQAEQAELHASVLEEQSIALRESEQRFRSAFNYAPIGIALVSPEGKWLKVNRALCEILGYTVEEFLAMNVQSVIFPEDLNATREKIDKLLTGQTVNCQMEQRYRHRTGRTVWTSWSVSSAGGIEQSDTSNLIFQIQDTTDKKIAEEKLQHEATHDILTGLPNRAFFMHRLGKTLGLIRDDASHKVSVLFIDLDRFKYVNDSLGHLVGDQLLIGIAQRLSECLRPSDIVARLGGDEFIILIEGQFENWEVTRIAERIQQQFKIPFNLSGHELYSSASIGILHASETHLLPEDIMRDADTAMYQAKKTGKARHEVFDEKMHTDAKETLQLETDLRKAVERGEIDIHYQPIFSLLDGRVEGVEALARWKHATLGSVSPAKFIFLAEEIGQIDALSEHLLRKACLQVRELLNASPYESSLKLSINLSVKQFARPTLVQTIKNILDETDFPADHLKLEITESVFFEYHEKAIDMLHELRHLGIEIDIDDFGTGYSNMSYLVRLPISTLKIDRSFVNHTNGNGANSEIVKTIIGLARNLGLKVIAEGIETHEQLELMRRLHCESGQGYLLARPMPYDALSRFLADHIHFDISEQTSSDIEVLSTMQ